MYKKELEARLDEGMKSVKEGRTVKFDLNEFTESMHKSFIKNMETTTPIQRLLKSIDYNIKELKTEKAFLKNTKRVIENSKIIRIKEFMTKELVHCEIHSGGKCTCHYGDCAKKYHPKGRCQWVDIGIYDPDVKDYKWQFTFQSKKFVENEKKNDEKFDKKYKPKYDDKDELVEKFIKQEIHDPTVITVDKNYVTKDDIIKEVQKFIKDYFKLDKKIKFVG